MFDRAMSRNFSSIPAKNLCYDPDIYLRLPSGAKLRPISVEDNFYLFELRGNHGKVTLCSRASRPSEVIGPFVDDRRRLGVLVGDITLAASASPPMLRPRSLQAGTQGQINLAA